MRKTITLLNESGLPIETKKNLRPQAPAPPRLYGLPKVHKEGTPLRPIVSAIGSPTYNLAKYLTGILSPYVGLCAHHIKNSSEFVQTLSGIQLENTDLLVSLDVVSLFTRVPLADTLRLLESKFDGETISPRFNIYLFSI